MYCNITIRVSYTLPKTWAMSDHQNHDDKFNTHTLHEILANLKDFYFLETIYVKIMRIKIVNFEDAILFKCFYFMQKKVRCTYF